MKFEDLQRANEQIRTTQIKGKDYAEVNQRVKAFKMLYPEGFIKTEIVSIADGICVMKATVGYCDDVTEHILATGTAYEKEDSSFINKTSYIENCETSAVGRALGFAGFGIDVSIASAEELQNAIRNQNASKDQIAVLKKLYTGENLEKLLEKNNIEKIEELTFAKADELLKKLKKEEV